MDVDLTKQFLSTLTATSAKLVHLEARCDALAAVLCVVARKAGLSMEKVSKSIDDVTAAVHQKRLEAIEAKDPSLAAEIDYRQITPDLPDELL
jgi:hypothetical protein